MKNSFFGIFLGIFLILTVKANARLPDPPGLISEPNNDVVKAFVAHGNFYRFLADLHERYGEYVSLSPRLFLVTPPQEVKFIFSDPKRFPKGDTVDPFKPLVGNGLFTAEGDLYTDQEKTVKGVFGGGNFDGFRKIMHEELVKLATSLKEKLSKGESFDIGQTSVDLTMAIAMRAFFGVEPDSDKAREFRKGLVFVQEYFATSQATQVASEILEHIREQYVPEIPGPNSPMTNLLVGLLRAPFNFKLRESDFGPMENKVREQRRWLRERQELMHTWAQLMRAICEQIIREREKDKSYENKGDLLSRLLKLREVGQLSFSDDQIIDEVATFFVAGHETTSDLFTALFWKHSRGETPMEVLEEIERNMPNGSLEHFSLSKLEKTDAYLRKVLVDYPPVALTLRKTVQAENFGDYFIPAGSTIILSQYVTHRSLLYKDQMPDESFEFGGGRRKCVGWRFAVEEAVMGVAVFSQFKLALLNPEQNLAVTPGITIGYSRSAAPINACIVSSKNLGSCPVNLSQIASIENKAGVSGCPFHRK